MVSSVSQKVNKREYEPDDLNHLAQCSGLGAEYVYAESLGIMSEDMRQLLAEVHRILQSPYRVAFKVRAIPRSLADPYSSNGRYQSRHDKNLKKISRVIHIRF